MNTQVVVPNLPSPTWNREEVEQTVTRMLAEYTNVVYTPDTAKSAKAEDNSSVCSSMFSQRIHEIAEGEA